jgi:putative CocE/NonD family hydrolase
MRTLGTGNPLPPPFAFRFAHDRPRVMQFFQDRIGDPSGIDLPAIEVPALVAATWSDQGLHSRGSFNGFRQISSEQKWLFTHGRSKWETYYSDEALQTQLDFFDHFLKQLDNGFDERPAVRLEVRERLEEYTVREEDEWPIARTEYRQLFLDADGGLTTTAPTSESLVNYDPADGRAEFEFVFDEDTELSGHMALRLWVSTDAGDDLDLFVGVEKRDADGAPVRFFAKTGYTEGPVAMGWLRVSERELDEELSRPWQPVLAHERARPVDPGEVVPVDIEILPSSTLFRAGESLVLVVQGRDLFEHPALAHDRTVNEGTHTLHTGGAYDAHLLVPVVPPAA